MEELNLPFLHFICPSWLSCCVGAVCNIKAALDASGKGGKGGGKGDRAQGVSQGVDILDKAMEAARTATY